VISILTYDLCLVSYDKAGIMSSYWDGMMIGRRKGWTKNAWQT